MFYHQPNWNQEITEAPVRALFSLTSAESKRLIAKGVATLPEVKQALKQGIVAIGRGTTNAFVVEELTGNKIEPKSHYADGIIVDGELSAVPQGTPSRVRPGSPGSRCTVGGAYPDRASELGAAAAVRGPAHWSTRRLQGRWATSWDAAGTRTAVRIPADCRRIDQALAGSGMTGHSNDGPATSPENQMVSIAAWTSSVVSRSPLPLLSTASTTAL